MDSSISLLHIRTILSEIEEVVKIKMLTGYVLNFVRGVVQ